MIKPTKRATIYIDADLHKLLKIRAAATDHSISEMVNEAIRCQMEDLEDLAVVKERENEPTVGLSEVLKELKRHGKI